MPRRDDIHTILVIGSGPIVIGQACEFDYSGTQACKALREEGYRVVLINSNPATIMTDPETADRTYVEPMTVAAVEQIIEAEKPDALLPTLGGQTALNLAIDLADSGVLDRHGVVLIGADLEAIHKAEDRELFRAAMERIGLRMPESGIAKSVEEAREILKRTKLPTIIRPSFTMGGSGGGVCESDEDFDRMVQWALDQSPTSQILVEQSVLGWKEFELEVMRDRADNVVIICSIENFDAMGVHTGDSITVAPAQTLTDREYQEMRDAAVAIMREIGVETGGSNVQFGVDPEDGSLIVIEMNPRVSRSSALASKATGFPIAKIAAKLAVGYTLDEIKNDITRETPASFEPTIDYVVTKIPRFTFEKFPSADSELTTQMKSVGEAMAIGRTFKESFQKAIRSLEIGHAGFEPPDLPAGEQAEKLLWEQIDTPRPGRPWALVEALRRGASVDELHARTGIDPWFLRNLEEIARAEGRLAAASETEREEWLRPAKQIGFADKRLADLWGTTEADVRALRHRLGIRPVYKRVDTCGAEFEAHTPYLYSTYEDECEAAPTDRRKIMILGGGPNRIGQGIEFDYCCVHAVFALRDAGFETIMVNCNPETVSTDYDTSDRLYFEPLTLEDVLEIIEVEKPEGVIVQFGGQTPLKLAMALEAAGAPIIGTPPDAIDRAEDRERFDELLERLGLQRPEGDVARSAEEAEKIAARIGYPVLVRPSYVLGGRAMQIVQDVDGLRQYMRFAVRASAEHPVLIDRFLADATEVDVDAICDGERVVVGGIMEHIEEAGVHSGDSACSLPPYSLSPERIEEIMEATRKLALEIGVRGLMNVQYAVKDEQVFVIEVNPRASRTVALRFEGDRSPPGEARGAGDGGQQPRRARVHERDRPQSLFGQGSRLPLREIPGGRRVAGARDEEHGGGDGDRLGIRASLCQGPDPGRQQPANRGQRARLGPGGGARAPARPGAVARRRGLPGDRDLRNRQDPARLRDRGRVDQQGARGLAAYGRAHRVGQCRARDQHRGERSPIHRGFPFSAEGSARAGCALLHDDGCCPGVRRRDRRFARGEHRGSLVTADPRDGCLVLRRKSPSGGEAEQGTRT